ncbi:HNH endonuclease signature motif containing protein [Streptacidiphilus cavernicola]|uniref:DUF222 domain-containing protein n=1 Tax=Streptacidiphilus cavernicola TaxID=3342716 RepID=A0ABV6UI35_9ACTN
MDALVFGGEAMVDAASGAGPSVGRVVSSPPSSSAQPSSLSAHTVGGGEAIQAATGLDWSTGWRQQVAQEGAGVSGRNGGVGGMLTDASGRSVRAGTPVSSRTAVLPDPLRSVPGRPQAMLAALAEQDQEALRATGALALGEQVLALLRLGEMLEAELLRRVAVFDAMDGATVLRSRSTGGFLATHGQLASAAARRLTARAGQLAAVPAVRAAQAAGTLSADQAQVIARHLAPVDDVQARGQAEELLLAHAPQLHLSQLARAAEEVRVRLVAEEEPPQDEAPAGFQSWVKLSATGTTDRPFWVLSGELEALAGERLRIALEAAAGPPKTEDPRTGAQRLGDALATVAALALNTGTLPVTGGTRPHLTLIADLDTLTTPHPHHHHDGPVQDPLPAPEHPGDPLAGLLAPPHGAFTTRGLRLDTATARQLACDCTLRVLLTRGQGRPLSIGRASRTIPPHIRDAVTARDRHCIWPGCQRPPSWCEGHHAIHWADGGPTSVDNITLLCPEHHHDLHTTGWNLTRQPNGHYTATPPPNTPTPPNTRIPPPPTRHRHTTAAA